VHGVRVRWAAIKETRASEHAVRFLMGGLVTAVVGWVGHWLGPIAGGLFLAFPAILPAGLTLEKHHEGRAKAADEALGAVAGSAGLAVFGLVVWLAPASWSPALVLAIATLGWLGVSVALWRAILARGSRSAPAHRT
jgi:hypothetical protein